MSDFLHCERCEHYGHCIDHDRCFKEDGVDDGSSLAASICSLTAFLTLVLIWSGIAIVTAIVGLALWLPVEIEKDGETIKERNDLCFKANEES